MHAWTSVLSKAIEFLCGAIFPNQTTSSSSSRTKDSKVWNSRKMGGWDWGMRLVTVSWWLSIQAPWKPLCSLNVWEPLSQIFTGPSCYSLGLIVAVSAWIRRTESWNSSTSETHQSTGNQRAIKILQPQINRTPSHMGLTERRRLLIKPPPENTSPNGGNTPST